MNATRHDVEVYNAQRTPLCLAVTRNTTQQLHNAKHCALEHCINSHILQQVVYVGAVFLPSKNTE